MIERNVTRSRCRHWVAPLLLSGFLAGCGGASVFTDDALVRANDVPVVQVPRDSVPAVQADGFPNPQQPTAPPIARDLTQDERTELKGELEALRDQQASDALKDQPADRAAAIRKAAADRKKKVMKEIDETDRSQ